MLISVSIGPFALMTNTLLTIMSAFLLWLLIGFFTKSKTYQTFATDTVFYSLFAGLLTARIAFVVALWEVYQANWWSALDIRDGGFNQPVGWFAGMSIMLIRCKTHSQLLPIFLKSALITGVVIFPLFVINTMVSNQKVTETIEVADIQGTPTTLDLKTGKPLIINFWASWCPPCRREMPLLQRAQQEHSNIEFVFVNQGEAPSKAQHFLHEQRIELENTYYDFAGNSAKQLGAFGLPTTLFFTAEGKMVNSHMGELSEASLQYYLRSLVTEVEE
ncbi:redoxin domain-containing protein [Alteromonas hispanica]|uniref:Redoxin domain-containing protein n=1 Tax=Alteromonas hispanica TaxID=315421 RepID=A0A6L9MW10_9ALTE|nr:redoxin domain-containing protein [Alteromonas hispanica]